MRVKRAIDALFSGNLKGHFGQYAEDVLVRKYFPHNTNAGTYLDIGAHHPFRFSNSAYFYLRGWNGINVDANKETIRLFNKYRPKDINIWAAVISEPLVSSGTIEIPLMLPVGHAENKVSGIGSVNLGHAQSHNLRSSYMVPAMSMRQIVNKYELKSLDYLNIDIEGDDLQILQEIDFELCKPKIITVEDFSSSFEELVESSITKLLKGKEYKIVGRAGYTSVFSFRGLSF